MSGRERVVVAMSGGVDSSVAAALLLERGFDVVGLFMRNGVVAGDAARRGKQGCCSLDDAMDARHVAGRLGVPFYAVDFAREFDRIIEHFVAEYERGRTPNPCVRCNRELKFGRLLDQARDIGADRVATGHYARLVEHRGRLAVARGRDEDKDQSYVLFPLEQDQLRRTLLPLGDLEKSEVRERARDLGLPVHDKPDSQEICFVPEGDYGEILRRRRPGSLKPGPILDRAGREVGRHEGHQLYTVGQRRGLGGGHGKPLYVVALRPADNAVVVGESEDLLAPGLTMDGVTWMGQEALAPGAEVEGEAKIRSRQRPVPARLVGLEDGRAAIRFREPQRAVTPGQAAVFYRDAVVLAGGWIDAAVDPVEADGG